MSEEESHLSRSEPEPVETDDHYIQHLETLGDNELFILFYEMTEADYASRQGDDFAIQELWPDLKDELAAVQKYIDDRRPHLKTEEFYRGALSDLQKMYGIEDTA